MKNVKERFTILSEQKYTKAGFLKFGLPICVT